MKQELRKKIVLFDFDGVIVDSFDISYRAARKVHPELTREEEKDFFNGNIYDAKGETGKKNIGAANEIFFREYVPLLFDLVPVKGMAEVIKELSEIYQLIVVSSTISSPIQGYLEKYALERHFDWIMGGEVHKSKTLKIQMVLGQYKVKTEDCVFVTDTLGDMREAAVCQVSSIGVTWGFHERERLQKGNFFALIDRVEEFVPAVQSFFKSVEKSKKEHE